jgi:tetratricopeptide (TPR) repeat protein
MRKSQAAAKRALEIDPNLAEAHTSLGLVYAFQWRFADAEREYQRALALNPGFVWGRWLYGHLLLITGRDEEALAQLEQARSFDPTGVSPIHGIAILYERRGDSERARRWLEATAELAPQEHRGWQRLGNHYCRMREHSAGIAELERAHALLPEHVEVKADLAYCYAQAGRIEEAREMQRQLEAEGQSDYVDPVTLSLAALGLGEREQALSLLERAYAIRAHKLVEIAMDPRFDDLRGDPRFREIVDGIGLGV